jgi:hypothetical protein
VATGARELSAVSSVIARIFGAELEAINKHIELADAGYTFAVAYCPSDLDTKRLMNVAHRFSMTWLRSTTAFLSRTSKPTSARPKIRSAFQEQRSKNVRSRVQYTGHFTRVFVPRVCLKYSV